MLCWPWKRRDPTRRETNFLWFGCLRSWVKETKKILSLWLSATSVTATFAQFNKFLGFLKKWKKKHIKKKQKQKTNKKKD